MRQGFSCKNYLEGIYRATQAGSIVFAKPEYAPLGAVDAYSHLGTKGQLTAQNARPLETIPALLIQARARVAETVVLESGVGAGVAAYDAYKIGQQSPYGVTVDAVGLTPVNPYCAIPGGVEAVYRRIENHPQAAQSLVFADNLDRLLRQRSPRLTLNEMCDASRFFDDPEDPLFAHQENPFIRKQLIGFFPEDFEKSPLDKGTYHIINDNNGPYLHSKNRLALAKEYSRLLADDGVLFVHSSKVVNNFAGIHHAGDIRFLTPYRDDNEGKGECAVLARYKSVLAKIMRERYRAHVREDGVVMRKDLETFIPEVLGSLHS